MKNSQKKIYFALSPHINYYHSYRGDSRGITGFGKDLEMMSGILGELEKIEELGLGKIGISWDYGDTFWSCQIQKEYQPEVLDRVIERCKQKTDEVLIGQWGNVIQSVMDTEEFLQQHKWFLENELGIGVNQLFPGRVAPYARTQESMFTQGMIELYNKIGVKGICNYYSVYGFDVTRPFLNPRLDWNQRYGLVKFNSTLSDASCLMIPTYAFGDILDFCSIKNWFKFIRKHQENGDISGHALLFLNFDMDYENWVGLDLPKFLRWMPNSRGLMEFAEAVNQFDYVEFTTLLDIIPKLEVHGETTLREDVADGMWNGYYNWAQKYNNTTFWTIGQRARWQKCITDTLTSKNIIRNSTSEITNLLRNTKETSETYLKNKILFASTTNFGMAMPFLHSDRRKTALNYVLRALNSSNEALNIGIKEFLESNNQKNSNSELILYVLPNTERGISEKEQISLVDTFIIRTIIPAEYKELSTNKKLILKNTETNEILKECSIYYENNELMLEALISSSNFEKNHFGCYSVKFENKISDKIDSSLKASKFLLKNRNLSVEFNGKGKIISFKMNDLEYACPGFLESSISYGKVKKPQNFNSKIDQIVVNRDGSDGFSASVTIISEFFIENEYKVRTEKILKLYQGIPYLFVDVSMDIPDIKGKSTNIGKSDGTSYFVEEEYQEKWQEIMPCEIRSNIFGANQPLKIWKRNFIGISDYFNLDMKEVDLKNADIDCLVANISDGWMGISNQSKGLLVGFNSLKAANFAFSPIKIRDKGFGDVITKGQQVRINPFGTYFGKHFHYWTEGNGHAQSIVAEMTGTDESTAPTFSGKRLIFELIISPFMGENPPEMVKNFADHFSFEPLLIVKERNSNKYFTNYTQYIKDVESMKKEFELEEISNLSFIEWVRKVNLNYEEPPTESEGGFPKISLRNMIKILIDGIKGR